MALGRRFLTAALGCIALAACSGSPAPTPSPVIRPSPDPLAPELQSVPVAPLGQASVGSNSRFLSLRPGWRAEEWAAVPNASMMVWTPAGDLLVSSPDTGKVFRVYRGEVGAPPQTSVLIDKLTKPFGLGISQAGGKTTLVVGTETQIIAFDLAGAKIGAARVLVGDIPAGGVNPLTPVDLSTNGTEVIYAVGSETDRSGREEADRRATIMRVPLAGGEPTPIATGVRYAAGMDFAPDGTLFAAIQAVQDPPYPYETSIDGNDSPAGRFGTSWALEQPVDPITRVKTNEELGWPYCLPDSTADGGDPIATDVSYVPDPLNNPDNDEFDCTSLAKAQTSLPAHSSPTSLRFLFNTPVASSMKDGALVVAHGSSSDAIPRRPGVYFTSWFNDTKTLGEPELLIGGFQRPNGSRSGRSVDAIPGLDKDERIYVSDDFSGLIYRITPSA